MDSVLIEHREQTQIFIHNAIATDSYSHAYKHTGANCLWMPTVKRKLLRTMAAAKKKQPSTTGAFPLFIFLTKLFLYNAGKSASNPTQRHLFLLSSTSLPSALNRVSLIVPPWVGWSASAAKPLIHPYIHTHTYIHTCIHTDKGGDAETGGNRVKNATGEHGRRSDGSLKTARIVALH